MAGDSSATSDEFETKRRGLVDGGLMDIIAMFELTLVLRHPNFHLKKTRAAEQSAAFIGVLKQRCGWRSHTAGDEEPEEDHTDAFIDLT